MSSIMLPITVMTAGAAALINLWLAMRTGSIRKAAKIDIGDGGNAQLIRRMRAHANFVEYTPFIVILIGLIEFTTGTSLWLWAVSGVFLLGRVGHALGMDGLPGGRMAGTIITFLLLLGLGGYAVVLPYLPHAATSVTAPSAVRAG